MIKISYEDILSVFLYKYHVLSYLFFIKEKTPVKKENIQGVTDFILFPFSKFGKVE